MGGPAGKGAPLGVWGYGAPNAHETKRFFSNSFSVMMMVNKTRTRPRRALESARKDQNPKALAGRGGRSPWPTGARWRGVSAVSEWN